MLLKKKEVPAMPPAAVWAAISNLNCLQIKEAAELRSAASFGLSARLNINPYTCPQIIYLTQTRLTVLVIFIFHYFINNEMTSCRQ